MLAFGNKVLIFGGRSVSKDECSLDRVLEFDVCRNKFKVMPPLPCTVEHIAAVCWGDQAILMGGLSKDGPSKQVFMYDSKTGNTIELPSMLENRIGCAAVITGNTVVVMGGRGNRGRVSSVEAFTLGSYSWRYLSTMKSIRSGATAAVLPIETLH